MRVSGGGGNKVKAREREKQSEARKNCEKENMQRVGLRKYIKEENERDKMKRRGRKEKYILQ